MEAVCLNPLVILGSLVPHVYLAVVSKRSIAHPISRACPSATGQQSRGIKLWNRTEHFLGYSIEKKKVQVPQKLRQCGFPLPFPEVPALCSSQGWTDSPCCVQFCRADLLSFQYIHNFPPCCKSSDKYFLIFKRKKLLALSTLEMLAH